MSDELITVIVNNYEYERFVGAAIESALMQGPSVEVVVVDDGSTDGSRDVIRSYGREVTAIFQENSGQAAAFNAGFAASSGSIVLFLDADDLLLPYTATELRAAFADPEVAKLHWALWEVDEDGRRNGKLRPEALMPEGDLRPRVVDYGPLAHSNPPTSGNAFSRQALERILPMPEPAYRICADAYLVMLASIYGTVRRSLTPLSCWRRHGENRYNGVKETVYERVCADLERYDELAAALAVHLEAQGTNVHPGLWRRRNVGYRRLDRMRTSAAEIESIVPEEGAVVLVDDNDWRQGHLDGRDLLPNRRTLRLFDGAELAEPPAETALIAELRRLERSGATHIVFVWPGAWWLQHYPGFERHLTTNGRRLQGNLLGFELGVERTPETERPLERLSRDAELPARRAQLARLDERIESLRSTVAALERQLATGPMSGDPHLSVASGVG
jgi:glycosyltransferase involved in cell wall biosynthesis